MLLCFQPFRPVKRNGTKEISRNNHVFCDFSWHLGRAVRDKHDATLIISSKIINRLAVTHIPRFRLHLLKPSASIPEVKLWLQHHIPNVLQAVRNLTNQKMLHFAIRSLHHECPCLYFSIAHVTPSQLRSHEQVNIPPVPPAGWSGTL